MSKRGSELSEGWSIAPDAEEVHELLCASDVFIAAMYGTPLPRRNRESTERLVSGGSVHLLRQEGVAMGMFTLAGTPAFTIGTDIFPDTEKPVYLQRLAVRPDRVTDGELTGLMCVRQAMEAAIDQGATAIRAESNPDLTNTFAILKTFGFRQYGPVLEKDGVRRTYLQNDLEISE